MNTGPTNTEPANTGPANAGPANTGPANAGPAGTAAGNALSLLDERLTDQLTDVAAAAPDRLGVTVEELRRRGARRRRTRIGVASAAVLLVAGGTAGGVLSGVLNGALGGGSGGGSGSGSGSGSTVGAPPATAGPAGRPSAGASAEDGTGRRPSGTGYAVVEPVTTIDTGEAIAGGTLTIWFAVHEDRFLQAVGQRGPDGKLALTGVTNDPDVTGTGPGNVGFHAGWEVGSGSDRFVTGYVVGDATTANLTVTLTVTLTVDGTPATAKVATWPENPAVHVWWLRVPAAAGVMASPVQVRDLVATDAAGTVVASLPNGGVGHG
jgi:hypothetical protein